MTRLSAMTAKVATAGTMEAFRVLGVPVRFHFTFVLLMAFLVVTGFSQDSGGHFALFLLGVLVSMLLHEAAHTVVAAKMGVKTLEVVMLPIGGVARYEQRLRPLQELGISLAGPLTNLLISGAIFAYVASVRQPLEVDLTELLTPAGGAIFQRLLFVNVLLAAFNLLPAFPMDGGRIIRALLSLIRPADEATRTAAWMGRMLAISMGLYGIFATEYILLVFFAFFIWMGAAQESTAALGRTLVHGIPVRAAMVTEFHRLDHSDTVQTAVKLLLSSAQQDFPVMHGDEVVGLLDRAAMLRGLAADGPDAYVAGVMDRDFLVLDPTTDLAEILPPMSRRGRCALVMDGTRLLGLLTTGNLSEFLLLRRYGMEPAVAPLSRA